MDFGNFLSDKMGQYSGGYNSSDMANGAFGNLYNHPLNTSEMNKLDYGLPTSVDTSNMWSNFLDNIHGNSGGWFNTLGRLGTGILGALGDYDSSSNQQAYIPYTQWLGNGLAKFSAINNTANKQNQQNQAYGNTLMLSSLFGPGKSLLGKFGGQIGRNYDEENI